MDSNHRRLSQLSYSQPHLATLVTAHVEELLFLFCTAKVEFFGKNYIWEYCRSAGFNLHICTLICVSVITSCYNGQG